MRPTKKNLHTQNKFPKNNINKNQFYVKWFAEGKMEKLL